LALSANIGDMNETTVADTVDAGQDIQPIDEADRVEPVAEPLIEEISIDGMCGVY
jgi:mycofactocin precursor